MAGFAFFEEVASFPLAGSRTTSMAALPGGTLFASGHGDSMVRVWTSTGDLVATLEGHPNSVYGLACTASGDIVSLSFSMLNVWRDYALLHTVDLTGTVYMVAVSLLDGSIVGGSGDTTAKVWSASTGECVATLEGHTRFVLAVCVLGNGDVVTGSADKTFRVWERGSWTCTAVYEERQSVSRFASLPGGGLAVGGGDVGAGFVSLWRSGMREWTVDMPHYVNQLAVVQGFIVGCTAASVNIIQDGVRVKHWDVERPCVAALSNSTLAMFTENDATCKPSRIATIHVMITAWSAHGGVPPPAADGTTAAAALGRTLSLRRLCRPRFDGDAVEVVEPFARDVVGYM